MSLCLIRAGSLGESESKFLEEGRVYVTWNDLSQNLLKHPRDPLSLVNP